MKKRKTPALGAFRSSGGGIRTPHGRAVYRFSRPARSTTLPPLPRCPAARGPAEWNSASLAVGRGRQTTRTSRTPLLHRRCPQPPGAACLSRRSRDAHSTTELSPDKHPRESSDSVRGHNPGFRRHSRSGRRIRGRIAGFAARFLPPHGNPAGGLPQSPRRLLLPRRARIDADAIILQVGACNLSPVGRLTCDSPSPLVLRGKSTRKGQARTRRPLGAAAEVRTAGTGRRAGRVGDRHRRPRKRVGHHVLHEIRLHGLRGALLAGPPSLPRTTTQGQAIQQPQQDERSRRARHDRDRGQDDRSDDRRGSYDRDRWHGRDRDDDHRSSFRIGIGIGSGWGGRRDWGPGDDDWRWR